MKCRNRISCFGYDGIADYESARVKYRSFVIAAIVVAVVGGAVVYAWQSPIAPIVPSSVGPFEPALVRKGALLARLGDCGTCHTASGGAAYAGGLGLPTPFGTIYSTNITPDAETGIGRWSEAAFVRALRAGVDREGRHLYPAFPYDHFTLVSDDDAKALYAFFMSRDPVKAEARANELPFPINIRLVLAGWKLLFLRQGRFRADPTRDEVWNRGRYLVDGLGHCGACHSPRNLMGAEEKSRGFEGGEAEGWRAYALGVFSQSPVPWDEGSLADYLANGFHPSHGVARGPMAGVVDNLAKVDRGDVDAMARYLASSAGEPSASRVAAGVNARAGQLSGPGRMPQAAGAQIETPLVSSEAGGAIYAAACASCHDSGRPLPLGGADLSLSTALSGDSPTNLLNILTQGLPAADQVVGPIMPPFADVLGDQQLIDLAHFLRKRFVGKPDWERISDAIRKARAAREFVVRSAANNTQGGRHAYSHD
jgi:mono/diheme cytochrome c family protein